MSASPCTSRVGARTAPRSSEVIAPRFATSFRQPSRWAPELLPVAARSSMNRRRPGSAMTSRTCASRAAPRSELSPAMAVRTTSLGTMRAASAEATAPTRVCVTNHSAGEVRGGSTVPRGRRDDERGDAVGVPDGESVRARSTAGPREHADPVDAEPVEQCDGAVGVVVEAAPAVAHGRAEVARARDRDDPEPVGRQEPRHHVRRVDPARGAVQHQHGRAFAAHAHDVPSERPCPTVRGRSGAGVCVHAVDASRAAPWTRPGSVMDHPSAAGDGPAVSAPRPARAGGGSRRGTPRTPRGRPRRSAPCA